MLPNLSLPTPWFGIDDTVTIHSKTGKSGRGIFRGAEEACAPLEAGGKPVRIPFVTMDKDARLRSDRPGRTIYIHTLANKRADAFLVDSESP